MMQQQIQIATSYCMLHFNIKDTEIYNRACNNLNQFRDDNDNKLGAEYDVFLFGCSVGKVMSYFKFQVYYDLNLDCHRTTLTQNLGSALKHQSYKNVHLDLKPKMIGLF